MSLRFLAVFKVTGDSMLPVLADGDFVITTNLRSPRQNSLVVVRHAEFGVMVKRVQQCKNESYWLAGENAASVNSQRIGWIDRKSILGVVLWSIRRKR